jgi:hypothetical protein
MECNFFSLWPRVILYLCFYPQKGHYSPKIEPFFEDNIYNFKFLSRPEPELPERASRTDGFGEVGGELK